MTVPNALLGIGRLNNFRLNALDPALMKERRTKGHFLLNGVDVRGRVRVKSVSIRDSINDSPDSASFTIEGPAASPYTAAVLADLPIAYWRLGDVGLTAFDQTGHGHTGTVIGAVTINQPGAVSDGDRAMHFPGVVGARVEVAAAADLALTAAVTVEAWVKTDLASQSGGILEKTIGGVWVQSYLLSQRYGSWVFSLVVVPPAGGTSLVEVTVPVEPADVGHWVHLVAGWYNGAGIVWLYKNGIVAGTAPAPAGTLNAGAGVVEIGHLGSNSAPFAGTIDEVAIYAFLSDVRIAAHYAYGLAVVAPTVAQEVRISIGVDDPTLLFNGEVTQVDLSYEGRAHLPIYHCTATDDTLRANRRRPFGQWTNVSVTTIAQALIATFVPGFSTAFVQAGLPPVTVIFDGAEGLNRCLTQLTNLIGGYWYFSDRQLHLFLAEATDAPDPIDATHPFLADPRVTDSVEMSQVRTRVYGRGHGEALLSAVVAGESLIPIASAVMFNASGGHAIALSQVLTYTGINLGGFGSLVGPGAAPSVALGAALATGVGLATGAYQYAYTFVTASGESYPGPLAAISVGVTAPPTTAPALTAPALGPGPDPGGHVWAVSFVTASGETTLGPVAGASTDLTPAPATPPTVGSIIVGAGPDPGAHDYAVSFVTTIGETTPGPRLAVTTGLESRPVLPPTTAPIVTESPGSDGAFSGSYHVYVTFVTAAGETTVGPGTAFTAVAWPNNRIDLNNLPIGPPGVTARRIYSKFDGSSSVFVNLLADNTSTTFHLVAGAPYSSGGQIGPPTNTAGNYTVNACQVSLANLPRGDANVTARKIYRTAVGNATLRLVTTIANNTATTFTDTLTDAALGAAAPSASTAHLQQFKLTGISLGASTLVTARRIYRTKANGATYYLATTLADNVTTVWTDTVPDASLGAVAPSSNTATANQVALSAIAVGATTVTARKIYRTAVNGAQLKLLTTLANNSTLTYLDAIADAALGAIPPASDTSGLAQPQGQVNAGSTSLPTASAGPFLTTGGWAQLDTQTIRYTGIAGNTLTGIPASGPGALVATVRFGEHILAAPMLTGVTVPGGALLAPVDTVIYIWIQRDDAAAQAAMARLDGGDGIYEYLVQDERRGEPSLTALCDAHLAAYKAPIQTVTYATRDLKTKSGKPVTIDLAAPPILGAFVIQDVAIDQFDIAPGLAPRFVVTASTVRFSFEDLLRQLAGTLENA